MSTNYSPELVTDGAVFVGDARTSSTATAGSRLYNQAGVDSTDVKLLIHGNEGSGQSFTDSSLSNHTVTTVGNTTHSTTKSKFSGGSIYFDGNGDYLSLPASTDFDLGTGAFTVDVWVNFSNLSAWYTIYGSDYNTGLSIYYNNNASRIYVYLPGTDGSAVWSPVIGTWYHIAVVRVSGGTITTYVNGVSLWSFVNAGNIQPSGTPYIGAQFLNGPSNYFYGYMDEFRITKGVALWTQDFTPPARRDTLSISDGMMYNGSCLAFDGGDDWVDCGSSPITSNSAFSWAAWINPINSSGTPFFLGTNVAGEAMVSYWDSSTSMVRVGVWGADRLTSNIAIPANNWGHTCWTWDGTTLRAYTNGVAAGTATPAAFNIASNDVIIGAAAASAQEFEGSIGDVKLYNVALSASQVKEIYQDSKVIIPSNVSQTNLMGWWPLAEGAGSVCYDGSGNGRDGTMTNMDAVDWLTGQTGVPQLVEGYNRPMLFDGSNDYLEVPDDSSFDTTTKVSVAAWVYADPSLAAGSRGGQIVYTRDGEKGYGLRMRNDGSGNLEIRFSNGSGSFSHLSGSTALSAGVWYHLCGTYDTAVGKKVYVNGVQDGSDTDTGDLDKGTGVIQLGTREGGSMFGGIFNEVIIYNSTLSVAQIQALAATGPNGGPLPPNAMALSNSSDIAGYWRNDSNLSWTDLSGNGNDTGSASGSPDALLFKQGYNGSKNVNTGRDGQGFPLLYQNNGAIGFDGVKDYVNITPALNWSDFPSVSTSLWIQTNFSGATNYAFLSWANASNSGGVNMSVDSSGHFHVSYRDDAYSTGSYPTLVSTATVNDGAWHHCVFTYGGDPIIYLDGLEVNTASRGSAMTNISSELTYIGHLANHAVGNYHFDGRVANLQIYNRALSYAEIQQNYNAQKSRFT